tara:strand:- start:628 stop:795 length:168 start_codon:yes stop_codon:yes gene_type:complete
MSKVIFDEKESVLIKEALNDFLANLKINNGSKERIQKMQIIIDKLPNLDQKNWVV